MCLHPRPGETATNMPLGLILMAVLDDCMMAAQHACPWDPPWCPFSEKPPGPTWVTVLPKQPMPPLPTLRAVLPVCKVQRASVLILVSAGAEALGQWVRLHTSQQQGRCRRACLRK